MALPWDDIIISALHVFGAALFVGGAVAILVTNRALRRRMRDDDAGRRDLVRYLGRAGAPMLLGGFVLAALTGLEYWMARGTSPLLLAKVGAAVAAGGATAAHVLLGRREGPRVALAAALGIVTVVATVALVVLGAVLRYA